MIWSARQTRNLLLASQAALKRKTKRIQNQSTRSTQSALHGTGITVRNIFCFLVLAVCSNETTAIERGPRGVGHVDVLSQSGGEGPVLERDHGGHRGPTAILPVRMRVLPLLQCSCGLRWACSGVSKVTSPTSNSLQLLNRSKCVHFTFQ